MWLHIYYVLDFLTTYGECCRSIKNSINYLNSLKCKIKINLISTKQGSWVLTKTEAAITEHTRVCRSALGPLLVLRLFAWCLGAAPDRGKGGVSDSFAFSPYCVTSSSLCVRICAYCCILLSIFSWYLWESAFFFLGETRVGGGVTAGN